jgi:hypothetical protein
MRPNEVYYSKTKTSRTECRSCAGVDGSNQRWTSVSSSKRKLQSSTVNKETNTCTSTINVWSNHIGIMSFHLGESAYSLLKLYLPSTSPPPDIVSLDRPRQVVARPTHAARQNSASMFRTSVSCIQSLPRHLRPILLGEGRAVDKESSSNAVHVMSIVRLIPLLSSLPS